MDRFDNWESFLCHHGIKGQKWGIRRYQNSDGTLTEEGKKRYHRALNKYYNTLDKNGNSKYYDALAKKVGKYSYEYGWDKNDNQLNVPRKWDEVRSHIHNDEYESYSGYGKRQLKKIENKRKELNDQVDSFWEEHKKQALNLSLMEKVKQKINKNKWQNTFIKNIYATDEYRTFSKKVQDADEKLYKQYRTLVRKIAPKWKDKTLSEIIDSVPEKDKEAVYYYYRFFNYDYI